MEPENFPVGVAERLGWYVYRLIDPRNGETFYVGKGTGNRVFQHARAALAATEDEDREDLKFQQIKEIIAAGLPVLHVIHRYNIDNEKAAFQIEAAVIDAYPGLRNRVGGHGSGDYGVRHVKEIIAEYAAQDFEVMEPLVLISIAKTFDDSSKSIYDAVRCCWRIDPNRAKRYKLVLAHRRGLVVGVFRPSGDWIPATTAMFPGQLENDIQGRYGFVGVEAEPETVVLYSQKRVPDKYRTKGAANPIRFIEP